MLEPKLSILDETDSGLDVDAMRIVADGVNKMHTPETSTIVITHYERLLDMIKPSVVHVLWNGKIVKTAGPELAKEIETRGYDWIKAEFSCKPNGESSLLSYPEVQPKINEVNAE